MRNLSLILITFFTFGAQARQVSLSRVEMMADLPKPFKIIDYYTLTHHFDEKVYDFKATGDYWPLIWIDDQRNNFDGPTFGLFTAMGDSRQGPGVHIDFHESINSMGSILGASLVGIDKSKQKYNFVSMIKNYFNRDSGWNIMQNNTNREAGSLGGGYGRDWWYDIFPNVLFFGILDKYPEIEGFDQMARSIADKFYEADKILAGNYQFSYFDYGKMMPQMNWICAQPDVAAGHSYVLYLAYKKFHDPRYLEGSISSLKALSSNTVNPSYEVLMPFGAYMAARLNAEQGTHFDVKQMLEWTFNGTAVCREGWGVIADNWSGFEVSGLMGSTVDHGGYGFLMNTYDMAWPLLPMVRYDQSYATAIGKWMLNAANAVRFMYPEHMPSEHQTIPELAHFTKGVIAYEGLIKKSSHPESSHVKSPVAQGDGPLWSKTNPQVSQFSVYGSGHVGFFGSTIKKTNVEGILELDLLATDFFKDPAYPTSLFYNPHPTGKWIKVHSAASVDLYDLVSSRFILRKVSGETLVKVPGKSSVVLVKVPSGLKQEIKNTKLFMGGVVVDYKLP